jgi:hypothetical protein
MVHDDEDDSLNVRPRSAAAAEPDRAEQR